MLVSQVEFRSKIQKQLWRKSMSAKNILARASFRASFIAVLALMACFAVQSAQASTVGVGTCPQSLIMFTTIQAAINAVPSGSVIKVCPGNYAEQLLITKKLTLEGIASSGQDATVITPPVGGVQINTNDQRGTVAAMVLVQNTAGPVTLSNLTVDGTGNQFTSDDLRGILYQDASGTVNHAAVRNIVPNDTPTGDQSGQGIMVETTNSSSAVLTVENSSVHNYNKNGIVARYGGAKLTAIGNYVQGSPNDQIASNGIEIAFEGATGTIKNNVVINNVYTAAGGNPANGASGILLYDTLELGNIIVSGNTVGNAQEGIAIVRDTTSIGDGVTVNANKIFGTSSFDAIDVCTNGNVITNNVIYNTAQSGVHLDASCSGSTGNNNSVTGNTVLESACAGYLFDSGTFGNGTPTGTFFTVPFPMTTSTAGCTIPTAPARARTAHKVQP
jgi:hypothetical protein